MQKNQTCEDFLCDCNQVSAASIKSLLRVYCFFKTLVRNIVGNTTVFLDAKFTSFSVIRHFLLPCSTALHHLRSVFDVVLLLVTLLRPSWIIC